MAKRIGQDKPVQIYSVEIWWRGSTEQITRPAIIRHIPSHPIQHKISSYTKARTFKMKENNIPSSW